MRTSRSNSWNWSLLAGLVLVGCGGPAAPPVDPAPATATAAVATAAPEVDPASTPAPEMAVAEGDEGDTPQQEATPAPKPGI